MHKKIESIQNAKVKEWKKLHMKKTRQSSRQFMIEGVHLVEEALKYQSRIEVLLIVEGTDVPQVWFDQVEEIYELSPVVMKHLSQIETIQGVAAICAMPDKQPEVQNGSTYILVDRVQDPGNFGTIIRTAEAAGVQAVFFTKGTVDLYNDKVIRATQGAIFHFPVVEVDGVALIEACQSKGIPVYGTALKDSVHYKDVAPSDASLLIVGNEGAGVDEKLLERTDKNIYLPIFGQSESLNVAVAAGILLYYLKNEL